MKNDIEIKKERFKKKLNVYLNILDEISMLSVSTRMKVSCMIIKNDFSKIASFGYNGNYSNAPINPETGTEEESLEPGKDGFIHAEQNALVKFKEQDPENYIVFISHSPCKLCCKLLANGGFKTVLWKKDYRETSHLNEIFERCGMYGKNVVNEMDDFVDFYFKNIKK